MGSIGVSTHLLTFDDFSCFLGREHHINRSSTTCSFQMKEFIDNSCEFCGELSERKMKPA